MRSNMLLLPFLTLFYKTVQLLRFKKRMQSIFRNHVLELSENSRLLNYPNKQFVTALPPLNGAVLSIIETISVHFRKMLKQNTFLTVTAIWMYAVAHI